MNVDDVTAVEWAETDGNLRPAVGRGWQAAAVAALLLATAGFMAVALALSRQQRAASAMVAHTLEIIDTASGLTAHLNEMASESGRIAIAKVVGLDANEVDGVAALDVVGPTVASDIAKLRGLTADNPRQQATLDRLQPLIAARTALLRAELGVLQSGDLTTLRRLVQFNGGRKLMQQIVADIQSIRAEERRLLDQRRPALDRAALRIVGAVIACGLLGSSTGVLTIVLFFARARTRDRMSGLRRVNAELEAKVMARTAGLAASEARQRGYFDSSPIGMVVTRLQDDGQFIVEDRNPAANPIYGFASQDLLGRTPFDLWPAAAGRESQVKLCACAASGKGSHYIAAGELRGRSRVLDVLLVPLPNDSGRTPLVLVCASDVTVQRETERQVIEYAEQKAQAAEREMALFRNSSDALSVAYVDGAAAGATITYEAVSPAFAALTGIPAVETVGRHVDAALPPDMAPAVIQSYRSCLEKRMTVAFATSGTTPLGLRDIEGSVTPVEHPSSGSIVRVVGAMRDVTARNLMEASLRHGQKLEAVGRLSAGVAHDFNNILQTIVVGLELVLDEVHPEGPAHEFATIAIDSAMRGASLTQALLSYARKQLLRPQTIDVAIFVAELQTLIARTLGPQIAIQAWVDPMEPVMADPGQLQTALLNLVINASHAMPGGGALCIAAHAEHEAGQGWAVITVSDTGIGMDDATLAHAADPFFTTKGAEGSGLGLSMVQGFAAQSGGSFRITSVLGEGTTVELRLPLAELGDNLQQPARVTRTQGSGRVILVDDSADVLATTGAALEKAGFEVVCEDSGDKALARLALGECFDVMITDYAMPGLNGADLIGQTHIIQPGLGTILMTGYAGIHYAERLPQGTLVLIKPFQRNDLIDAVTLVMGQASAKEAVLF